MGTPSIWTITLLSPNHRVAQTRSEKSSTESIEVKSVPRMGHLEVDLEKLFARLTGQTKTLEFVRTSKKVESHPDPARSN